MVGNVYDVERLLVMTSNKITNLLYRASPKSMYWSPSVDSFLESEKYFMITLFSL